MIDIHSHILPGLDDGARSLNESIEMARQAVQQGIHKVIATPHHANGMYQNELLLVRQSVLSLNTELQQQGIPLEVYTGQEIRMYRDLLDDLDRQLIETLDGSGYMLIEFPSGSIPSYTSEVFHELRINSITPIIAHPERNVEITKNPEKLLELVEEGALSQVTAQSVSGGFGKSIQALSLELCKHHLAHFIASDAHNMTNRPFGLAQAYQQLGDKLGADYVDYFQNNAESVINHTSVQLNKPQWPKRKWFHFWK
ncbi:tyrosine-protein phosphatase [Paenibacillus eucommiae]|uniref:Tyrosine-protein phosphatase n=1 Tax=Paenibacillus eucommiae TaxID=1355755 RepID=A0ABS4J0R4_9BACL|nr:CpsB/CapC family capsule biosynthesis tyrosine phosphatase [Paenibacillus eucommiae]MBP1993432.1 protein-tyrosine phosphatase [Paenibacillus eucommiae]